MKKIDFKTRAQWGYFKSAIIGLAIGILIAPGIKDLIKEYENLDNNIDNNGIRAQIDDTISSVIGSITVGSKAKIVINGDVVAIAKSTDDGEEAFRDARLTFNKDGVKPLWVDMECIPVDTNSEEDKALLKEMKTFNKQDLTDMLLTYFDSVHNSDRTLAYTMRIDDYTVTVEHFEDIVSVLEQAQSTYDENDEFQVGLKSPASKNVTLYEVEVNEKLQDGVREVPDKLEDKTPTVDGVPEEDSSQESLDSSSVSDEESALLRAIASYKSMALTAGESTDEDDRSAESTESVDEVVTEDEAGDSAQENEQTNEAEKEDDPAVKEAEEKLSAEDGIKYVGFSDRIQVVETYVSSSQIKDKDTVFNDVTTPVDETGIYVVVPGDCLSIIAEKVGMTEEKIKELNEGIENDDDIYYDDRLNIVVPTPPVEIMVEKQETYTENYYADVEYQDDDSMYIGETSVVQEGTPGKHTVTDIITYKGSLESGRKHIDEIVEVPAVAEIVLRGTKSKPTYMFPVTNWTVTSNFGYRWGRLHAGTDVGVPQGTTVRASRGGQIITAGWVGGYGNCVIIDHGDGVSTRYGHLSQVLVSVGQYVDQGDQIALSGNTGRSTGPHLHFEIRINGEAVDPLPYLYQ